MKSISRIISLIFLILFISWLFPAWWWILIIPFIFMTFLVRNLWAGFGNAFLAGLFSWGGIAIFQFSTGSEIIAGRVAKLFGLPSGVLILLVVMFLAAIMAGIAGMTGSALRSLFVKEQKSYYY